MDLDDIKRGLRAEIKKRENEQYLTFQCNVRQMCKDVLAKLEEQELAIAELEKRIDDGDKDFEMADHQNERLLKIVRHHKYNRCLAMARWCWAIKELNRYGDQDYMDFAEKWRKRWLKIAEQFKDKE